MTEMSDDRLPIRSSLFRVPRTVRLFQTAALFILCLLLAAPLVTASSRKARQLYDQGRRAEVQKDYDGALQLYEQAQIEDPEDNRYQLSVRRMRYVAAQAHVDIGRRLRDDEGLLQEALAHFQRAIEIDPSLTAAAQQYQRTLDLIQRRSGEEKGEETDDLNASAIELDHELRREMVDSMKAPAVLRPLSTQPIDISMSQQLKVVFETIGKLAGINVLFDPEFQDKRVDISIQDATLTEALDYVSLITQAYWKPITHNAIFVTNDTTAKRRDFEEKIVKTIYLNNVATPQELQEIVTAIRGLTDIRRMFPVTSMNALVVRGSRAELALVDKLVYDIDKARPEVVIDVLVLEVSRSRTRELGFSPTAGNANGIRVSVPFTGGAVVEEDDDGTTPNATVPLSRLGRLGTNDWVTTLPGAQLTALFSRSDSNLLQSPRIRATDNQLASLHIGERIPIATGSFQSGVGGVGANGLVNTQFSFEEVGVNIDITPKIHNDREISMHIAIEISNVRDFLTIGDLQQPIISQKTIEHDIRLEEGEASILGGLNQNNVFTTKSGVPFLGEIPILGRLFSVKKVDTAANEILIVVIPHIVRLPTIDETNLREIASGTEAIFQVAFQEKSSGEAALPAIGAAATETQPAQAATPPAQTPSRPTPTPVDPTPGAAATPGQPQTAAPTEPQPGGQPAAPATLMFEPGQISLAPGEEITVSVIADSVTDLFGSPLRVAFDPAVVNVVEITAGSFLEGPERTDLIFSRNIRNQVGQAAVNISRFPGTGGATGRGELIQIRLRGIAVGQTQLNVAPTGARSAGGNPMVLQPAALQLTVQ